MANLIRVSKLNDYPSFPLKKSTIYKWLHVRKHPELFVKIGGAAFLDMDAFNKLVEQGRLA